MAAPMKICGKTLQILTTNALKCHRSGLYKSDHWYQNIVFLCCTPNQIHADTRTRVFSRVKFRFCKGGNFIPNCLLKYEDNLNILRCQRNLQSVIYPHNDICRRYYVNQSGNRIADDPKDVKRNANKQENVKEVKENIWTVPNLLTMARIMLTPVIGYLVVEESYTVALGLFSFAGLTDLLDGYIARNFKNQMSTFGTALDPLADKILITVLTITLTTANLLPVPLAAVIIGRDVFLIAAGFVIRYMSLPPPITLKRYFDVTNPSAKILPSTLSKINTMLQLSLVCLTLAAPVFGFIDHPALQCLWGVTAATTVGSGVGYVINRKKSVQFLHRNSKTTMK